MTKKITLPSPSRGPARGARASPNGVDPQEEQRDERQVQEVPVEVLEDEREARLHRVLAMDRRLADGAARRVGEVEAVVGLPVVVAGGPEAERDPQDQEPGAEPATAASRERSAARTAATGSRRPRTAVPKSGVQRMPLTRRGTSASTVNRIPWTVGRSTSGPADSSRPDAVGRRCALAIWDGPPNAVRPRAATVAAAIRDGSIVDRAGLRPSRRVAGGRQARRRRRPQPSGESPSRSMIASANSRVPAVPPRS